MQPCERALYIHIPFCRARCAYCDFNSYAGLTHVHAPYIDAVAAEARWLAQRFVHPITTIYLGGGTPTVLPVSLLNQLLTTCRDAFAVREGAEISIEANPGTVSPTILRALRRLGVNRISLGAQSFEPHELAMLGRIHSAEDVGLAVRQAWQAGFDNLNLDLIFGLPTQDISGWRATVERALMLTPQHLSLYSLTVEEGTRLYDRIQRGDLPEPDPDLAADMAELAGEMLSTAGFQQYEISNWSLPGFECAHNLVYWRNRPYLGLGAGAHSSSGDRRWWNVRSVDAYLERLSVPPPIEELVQQTRDVQGTRVWDAPAVEGVEVLDRAVQMGETMMLGLRLTREGVTDASFRQRFGSSMTDVFGDAIREMVGLGLLIWEAERLCLTPRGRLLGNRVFARFLPD
jgi:putative oxygen-independent coproporphyrinogen III oxidase